MLQLDDVQLYDLSEAGTRLFSDPARLARLARLRRVPAARVGADVGLPAPWVDAESGESGSDPASLKTYWLERLKPPGADARRPKRPRDQLPAEVLLGAEEAGARLFATRPAVERLTLDGTLPALRVEGAVRYDAVLVELVAEGDASAGERRALVDQWAQFEYGTIEEAPPARPTFEAFAPPANTPAEAPAEAAPAPGAYEIPDDLGVDEIAPLPDDAPPRPPSTLIEADGFETVDDDE